MTTETGAALPITEQENPRSKNLSSLPAREIVALMNAEDATVATAVEHVLDDVAKAVEETVARLRAGGKLYYVGTGTSGRLGVCLLYTSDAADERSSVDLGGRRII